METTLEKPKDFTLEQIRALKPRLTKYIPHIPTIKQQAFLLLTCKDAFYGGAVGGGKSDALLMAALQYVDIPGYNALLLRDTYQNLNKPEALMWRAAEWLSNTDAHWNGQDKIWTFPGGGSLSFGYLDSPLDHFNYLSSAYQFIGIDEAVGVRERSALYLFSRMRRLKENAFVPLRFRCASNPPTREQMAIGKWIKDRYVDPKTKKLGSVFIPAKLQDNPYLEQEEYLETLEELDPVTKRQLRDGDWEIKEKGRMMDADKIIMIDKPFDDIEMSVRFWDLAATEDPIEKVNRKTKGNGPDFTAGCRMGVTSQGFIVIEDMVVEQLAPGPLEDKLYIVADNDGTDIMIGYEEEGGSSGKITTKYLKSVFAGFPFKAIPSRKSKYKRAIPLSGEIDGGNIYMVRGRWNRDFKDQLEEFPDGAHDDMVDACSGAFNMLQKNRARFSSH